MLVVLSIPFFFFGFFAVTQHFERAHIETQDILADEHGTVPDLAGVPVEPVPPAALALLAKVDPSGYRYLRSGRAHVLMVLRPAMAKIFGSRHAESLGVTQTPVAQKPLVVLNSTLVNSPDLQAAALAHELVHARHGDPDDPMSHHSAWRHLWRRWRRIHGVTTPNVKNRTLAPKAEPGQLSTSEFAESISAEFPTLAPSVWPVELEAVDFEATGEGLRSGCVNCSIYLDL